MKLRQHTLLLLGLIATMFNNVMADPTFPINTDWPFSETRARQLQEETASALNLPVEYKLELHEDVELVLILIPAGEFLMGNREDVSEFPVTSSETPQRLVRISRPFYLSKHPVTIGQWRAVLGANPSMPGNTRFTDHHPVVHVSWNDICGEGGFLEVLNHALKPKQFSGSRFRLPTEAEWEYACRAGTTGDFSGNGILDDMGWYVSNVDDVPYRRPRPIGLKRPNAWNLYDMHGNVSEWCADWYNRSYYQSGQWIDPTGPIHGNQRVLRGGSVNSVSNQCRSASRGRLFPHRSGISFGFRIVFSQQLSPNARADDKYDAKVKHESDGLVYIGSETEIDNLIAAKELLEHNPRFYDNLLRWRNAIMPLVIIPLIAEKISAGDEKSDAMHISETDRILLEQIRLKLQADKYIREDMIAYLEGILPHWEDHSGRNTILLSLARLHSDNPEMSLKYYKRVVTDRSAPPADRWGMDIQGAWQAIARIHEENEDYGKAIAALNRWSVSEPCGTGAAASRIRRLAWLMRMRKLNSEDISVLKDEVWQSMISGELGRSMSVSGVAKIISDLYNGNLEELMDDAQASLAILDEMIPHNDQVRWRRKCMDVVINDIALQMRLAGSEWRMTAEEAREKQRIQADSRRLPVEKTVMFDEVPMVFMFIPEGEFLIGSPPDEKGRISPDENQDRVRISRPFYMEKYEITQLQWQNVMGSNPSHFKDNPDSPMRPVDSVSWNDIVQQFLPKIQQYAPPGMRFDLPTEAQWEYACRAGTDTPFHFGETPDHNSANIGGIIEKHNGRLETMPVGSFPANAWGLHDMHGNVREWCKDTFGHSYYRSHNAVAVDPVNKGGRGRVIRGIWYPARLSRSAYRSSRSPDHSAMAGFRLALVFNEDYKNETEHTPAGDVLKAAPEE